MTSGWLQAAKRVVVVVVVAVVIPPILLLQMRILVFLRISPRRFSSTSSLFSSGVINRIGLSMIPQEVSVYCQSDFTATARAVRYSFPEK